MPYTGRVHKYRDDVNTDEIIPARYLHTTDRAELARHCMEDIDKGFVKKVKPGDMIVAGKNFGCGSSREHAPIAIKACGISCVIAATFARIFLRNSINMGLSVIESEEASKRIRSRDMLRVDTERGIIRNVTRKESYRFEKYPPFMRSIVAAGGLMNAIKRRKAKG